jgi:hypothetical protein
MTTAGPMSPCINVCSLDERGYCRGCQRTRDEIAGWMGMSSTRRWEVLRAVEERRQAAPRAATG